MSRRHGACWRRADAQVRLRLPNIYTGAVAPVACFVVLGLPRAATAESRTGVDSTRVTAVIDSTRIRMEVRAAHQIVVTLSAQPTQRGCGGHAWDKLRRISREDRAKSRNPGPASLFRRASGTVGRTVGSSRLRSSRASATVETTLNVSCSAWDCASGGRPNDPMCAARGR